MSPEDSTTFTASSWSLWTAIGSAPHASSRFLAFICLGLIVSFQKPICAVETIRLKSDRGAATVGACLPLGVGVLLK